MYYLTFEQIIDLHESILKPQQDRGFDENLVRSVMGTVEGGAFGTLFHPTIIEAGNAYLYYFARGQAFNDGNKRTGVITCDTFLDDNGLELKMAIDPDFVEKIGAGKLTKEQVLEYLETLI